jgi:hypothetical protein
MIETGKQICMQKAIFMAVRSDFSPTEFLAIYITITKVFHKISQKVLQHSPYTPKLVLKRLPLVMSMRTSHLNMTNSSGFPGTTSKHFCIAGVMKLV